MKAVLMRTGSLPVHRSVAPTPPNLSLPRQNSLSELPSGDKSSLGYTRISLHITADLSHARSIRRVLSDSDLIRPERDSACRSIPKLSVSKSRAFPAGIPEAEEEDAMDGLDPWILSRSETLVMEPGSSGGGFGKGVGDGGSRGDGHDGAGHGDKRKIGDYYREMLKGDPNNSLLLMNYGKFLYEVENDVEKAEEYYGRAILANPDDGEALYLYGKLIWETHRDEERAKTYFDQAVYASPNDCMLMGSYAHFMWEADEEDEVEMTSSPTIVSAA